MEKIFVIQDARTREFYWVYRVDEGFSMELKEAKEFDSIEDAEKEISDNKFGVFDSKILEIKTYYKVK